MSPTERAELRRLGERLIALAEGDVVEAEGPDHTRLLNAALREISRRKSRKRALPSGWVGEAAWDILLDLFVMDSLGRRVSMTSACIASNCPPTTGLRWVHTLIDGGYILRELDPSDIRRSFVRLSYLGETIIADALRGSLNAEQITIEAYRRRVCGNDNARDLIAQEAGISATAVELHLANLRT